LRRLCRRPIPNFFRRDHVFALCRWFLFDLDGIDDQCVLELPIRPIPSVPRVSFVRILRIGLILVRDRVCDKRLRFVFGRKVRSEHGAIGLHRLRRWKLHFRDRLHRLCVVLGWALLVRYRIVVLFAVRPRDELGGGVERLHGLPRGDLPAFDGGVRMFELLFGRVLRGGC